MTTILVGDKYLAVPTTRNSMNAIDPRDDIRIGFVDSRQVSIHVIGRGGSARQLAVPLDVFGSKLRERSSSSGTAQPFLCAGPACHHAV